MGEINGKQESSHNVFKGVFSPTKKRKLNEDLPFQSNASLHQGSEQIFLEVFIRL